MALALGDASAILVCCLVAAVAVVLVLAVWVGAFDARVGLWSGPEGTAELDASFDRGTADAAGSLDLMPVLPPWIDGAMGLKQVSSALFDKAGLVCAADKPGPGTETLACHRSVGVPESRGGCKTDYTVEASFDYGRLSSMKGRRARFCS